MPSNEKKLKKDFLEHLCQTSSTPMGVVVKRAYGSTVIDIQGKRYLDFMSGIGVASVGHAHPKVVRAIQKQAEAYLHVMVYGEFVQEPQVRLATALAKILPSDLSICYFTNSGTEANEGALKVAKKFNGRKKLIAFDGSFHGDSHGSLSVTGRSVYRNAFLPLLPNVTFLPFNDTASLDKIDGKTAAVIAEPIQSEGGVRIPSNQFLPALRRRCDETGSLLILDEAMTGLGRTGKLFAFQHWGVRPDILVLAKSLGGGMPLGAFISSPEIMRSLSVHPPLSHVTTFGGHPVSCAAGLEALGILLSQKLYQKSKSQGLYLLKKLEDIRRKIGGIREIRGMGLLIGLELENADLTQRFAKTCREAGLILGWTLHSDTVIRLAPPLVITKEEIDQGLSIISDSLVKELRL